MKKIKTTLCKLFPEIIELDGFDIPFFIQQRYFDTRGIGINKR